MRGGITYADSLGRDVARHVAAIEADGGMERPLGFDVSVRHAAADSLDVERTAAAAARLREIGRLLAGLGADRIREGGGGTDISPLMRRGVPGIGLRTSGEHYFDWHHSPADMLDKVDPIELRRNLAALAVLVYVLADMPEDLTGPVPGGRTRSVPAAR
jgi:Zn-dependent M28 family amino/carboxypeptidase